MYPHVSTWNKSTYSGCNTVNLELRNISLRWPCMPKMACETSLAGNLGDPTAGFSFSLTWWWCMFFWCLNYSDNIGLNFPLILDFQWLKLHLWFFMIFTHHFTWLCHVIPPFLVDHHPTPPWGTGFGLIGKVVKFLGCLEKLTESCGWHCCGWYIYIYVDTQLNIHVYI